MDIICLTDDSCWMHFILWIDSYGTTAVKVVKSQHSKVLKLGSGEPKVGFEIERKAGNVKAFGFNI